MKTIVPIIWDKNGPVARATVRINIGPNSWITSLTDESGMCQLEVGDNLDDTQFECYACNYKDYGLHINLRTGDKQIRVGMPADPARPQDIILMPLEKASGIYPFSREELLKFRGALWIKARAAWYTRPNQDDNVASTDQFWHYNDEDKVRILAGIHSRNYTHGPVGPFIDGGYHNLIPPTDFRDDAQRALIEQSLLHLNAEHIITPLFLTPDGWTIEQLNTIAPIF
jgi:hypothetical protein